MKIQKLQKKNKYLIYMTKKVKKEKKQKKRKIKRTTSITSPPVNRTFIPNQREQIENQYLQQQRTRNTPLNYIPQNFSSGGQGGSFHNIIGGSIPYNNNTNKPDYVLSSFITHPTIKKVNDPTDDSHALVIRKKDDWSDIHVETPKKKIRTSVFR